MELNIVVVGLLTLKKLRPPRPVTHLPGVLYCTPVPAGAYKASLEALKRRVSRECFFGA